MTYSDHNGLLSEYKYYFYDVLKYVTIIIGAATSSRANFSDLICSILITNQINIVFFMSLYIRFMRNLGGYSEFR